MITKIQLDQVASYKRPTFLSTDKKINLIYGLNGTGKSTLSNFLYDPKNSDFNNCSLEGITSESVLVYNQRFIRDYFYEDEKVKGIFTLSKQNKDAEQKINSAILEKSKLEQEKIRLEGEITAHKESLNAKKSAAESQTWEIKAKYSGGDRVLEYCLRGLMGKKEALYNHIASISLPSQKPEKDTDVLKKEVESLRGNDAQKYFSLPKLSIKMDHIEKHYLLQKEIVGNKNSTIAELINNLDNSDWVKKGIEYIRLDSSDDSTACPFCQEKTITKSLTDKIKSFFDATYENDTSEIRRLAADYNKAKTSLPTKESFTIPMLVGNLRSAFDIKYLELQKLLVGNGILLDEKVKIPGKSVSLTPSLAAVEALNFVIESINKAISEHNLKLENRDSALETIRDDFWNLLRWQYQHLISSFKLESDDIQSKITAISSKIKAIESSIIKQSDIIAHEQRNTVNIDESISKINKGLLEIGIDGFSIEKYSDVLYKIARPGQSGKTFQTLSEGEKMIISFLYFCELCAGKRSISDSSTKKIVVIDDPISSLSHIYVFNVGVLIKNIFFNSTSFEQVFILTHSLYFFYDLTHLKKEKRDESQKLFRIVKNSTGSQILEMRYEEIQNDYHSYWSIIKDPNHPPALIANSMRNVIEYFFNFIERKDLNNVFQKPELADNRFKAFCRYVDRESHSAGQNIFDIKEFDYDSFKLAFELVFKTTGYEDHHKVMMKR